MWGGQSKDKVKTKPCYCTCRTEKPQLLHVLCTTLFKLVDCKSWQHHANLRDADDTTTAKMFKENYDATTGDANIFVAWTGMHTVTNKHSTLTVVP